MVMTSGTSANNSSVAAKSSSSIASAAIPAATSPASRSVASKSTSSAKMADSSGRKLANTATDGATQSKRSSTQKAWTSGSNPLTRQPQAGPTGQQNGAMASSKPSNASKTGSDAPRETNTPDRHANDRLVYVLANFMGLSATVTVTNGDQYEGVFSGASTEPGESAYLLQMVRHIKKGNVSGANGIKESSFDFVGEGENFAMTFSMKEVVNLLVGGVNLESKPASKMQNGAASSFQTDTDISGNRPGRERTLQKWAPAETDSGLSLEAASNDTSAGWDQFEANERLYGVQSNYNEEFYTTRIDKSHANYQQRAREAERLAREIEQSGAHGSHMREERGLALPDDGEQDEEDKYSGVRRATQDFPPLQSGINRYTPPARRPPTGQPTVRGAPVDPAIISSQISRPDIPLRKTETRIGQPEKAASPGTEPKPSATADKDKKAISDVQASQASTEVRRESKDASTTTSAAATEDSADAIATPTAASQSKPAKAKPAPQNSESHTANVETDVHNAFKQFANNEKMRVQERRRNQVKHDKDIKLNDLMKFSKSFKLTTPVPKDLLSILARDPDKQEAIEKAARQAAESGSEVSSGKRPLATFVDQSQKPPKEVQRPRYEQAALAHPLPEKQAFARSRGQNAPSASYNPQRSDRQGPGYQQQQSSARSGPALSQRLANIQHQQSQSAAGRPGYSSASSSQDARAPPTGPAAAMFDNGSQRSSAVPTPLSAASGRFNAQAIEFRPNPAATSFAPPSESSAQPSPISSVRPASRMASPSVFWAGRKPLPAADRPSVKDYFNPIKRLKKEARLARQAREGKDSKDTREFKEENGGIPWAHRTLPRWDVAGENAEKTYIEVFELMTPSVQMMTPQSSHSSLHPPHPHQIPFHLQHGSQSIPTAHSQHQIPHHLHPHPTHHPGMSHQYDDHRMQLSASNSSIYPSPRLPHASLPYQSPMPQNAQIVYGQPIPYVGPGGPPLAQYRSFSNGPQFIPHPGHQNGAPMMAHNPSSGPYMPLPQNMAVPFNQQIPVYGSPAQGHAFPHQGPQHLPHGSSGYPSPGRGAPMMIHQGSQSGHPPPVMMYSMSPAQQHQPVYAASQSGHIPAMRGGYPQQPQYAQNAQHHPPYSPQYRGHGGSHSQNAPHPHPHYGGPIASNGQTQGADENDGK